MIVKIATLSSCKNFVSDRDKFIFDAFVMLLKIVSENIAEWTILWVSAIVRVTGGQ